MILKIAVLVGLAIYFFRAGEAGLAVMAAAAVIPGIGLLLAALLTVILLVKGWYGSAAIVAGLVAWNLAGNYFLSKRNGPPAPNPPAETP